MYWKDRIGSVAGCGNVMVFISNYSRLNWSSPVSCPTYKCPRSEPCKPGQGKNCNFQLCESFTAARLADWLTGWLDSSDQHWNRVQSRPSFMFRLHQANPQSGLDHKTQPRVASIKPLQLSRKLKHATELFELSFKGNYWRLGKEQRFSVENNLFKKFWYSIL